MSQQKIEKTVIVAHGDFDGIASAVLLAEQLGIPSREHEMDVIFTQPFLVDKVKIADDIDSVYVVDIAMNNRDPEMTTNFIQFLGTRLKGWYDHHAGWSGVFGDEMPFEDNFVIDETAPSCAAIIGGNPQLVADANATDTRQGKLSEQATLIERACRADMRDDSIKEDAVAWLLGDWGAKFFLEDAAAKYAEIQRETERLATTYEVDGNIATVDARFVLAESFDLTQLLLAGQKIATFAATTHTDPRTGEEMVTVATQWREMNLVELFGLPSGASFRVTLPIARLEEVGDLRDIRPCACGSGEPWASCHADSPYCG